jgi:spoIIIJ-associated protein
VQQTGVRSRLMLDIGGYREHRRTELIGIAQDAAARARDSGAPVRLDPMNPFERKVVHDAVAAVDGVRTDSEGEEPERYVVVHPEA